jgi:hypothetical protein
MHVLKEKFLRNEFLTMSVLGALGRSRTYSESASDEEKSRLRDALRKSLEELARDYISTVNEEKHFSNITSLSDNLTSNFHRCLRNKRFRIGIAQKGLNLYLKYLWCASLIPEPPHCPIDSRVISRITGYNKLNWTSIDSIDDYLRLIKAAKQKAKSNKKSLPEWELEIWEDSRI